MRVLVSGATGFVGGYLLRELGRAKTTMTSLHLVATARRRQLDHELAPCADAYVPADLAEAVPTLSAAVCIHSAGLVDDRSTSRDLHAVNLVGTRNLLNALRDCGLFIYVSSASVYGPKETPLCEEDAGDGTPQSEYGRSKWAAEQCVREECERRGMAHVILRPRAIYGIGDRVLLPRLKRLMRPPRLLMIGSGESPMSLTYIGHLAGLIISIVFAAERRSGTFNVADACVYRMKPVLSALYAATYHSEPRIVRIPVGLISTYLGVCDTLGRRASLSRQSLGYLTQPCVLDCTQARETFGYAPSSTLFDHVGAMGLSREGP
jgi:nucleoside-diphosphate-sugar epimerase